MGKHLPLRWLTAEPVDPKSEECGRTPVACDGKCGPQFRCLHGVKNYHQLPVGHSCIRWLKVHGFFKEPQGDENGNCVKCKQKLNLDDHGICVNNITPTKQCRKSYCLWDPIGKDGHSLRAMEIFLHVVWLMADHKNAHDTYTALGNNDSKPRRAVETISDGILAACHKVLKEHIMKSDDMQMDEMSVGSIGKNGRGHAVRDADLWFVSTVHTDMIQGICKNVVERRDGKTLRAIVKSGQHR